MRGTASEQARRQMLADMGITVWRPRTGPRTPAARPELPPPESRMPRPSKAAARSAPAPEEAVREPVAPARPAIPAPDRWAARSLVVGDVMLLVDGHCSRRDLRLAADVLAAASREWRQRPVSRQFQWPPNVAGETLPPAADDGRRAFNAFVDKDVADHRLRLIVYTVTLAERLADAWPQCRRLEIPALDVLGREGDAKRTLWRALRDAVT